MKKTLTTLFASIAVLMGLQAQEQKHDMYIHFADGSRKVYHVEKIDSVTFKEAVDYSNLKFDIKISNITSNGATTTVSCNRPDVLFYNEAFKKSYFEQYTIEELAQGQLEYMYEDWEQYQDEYKWEFGEDITFADFFCPGYYVDTYTYSSLKPETEYVVIAFGVDLNTMEVVGTPDTLGFTTIAPEPSSNVISFSVANDSLYITTTNDDPYFWTAFLPEDIAEYGEDATAIDAWNGLVADLESIGYMDYFTLQGSETIALKSQFYGLPGTHTLVAAGWNGVRTTDYFVYELVLTEEQVGSGKAELTSAQKIKAKQLSADKAQPFHSAKKFPLQRK